MWFKVDDGFHSHVKRHKAGLEAVGAWTIAGSWSGQNLTEGYIPPEICATIAPPRVWTKLRAAGLTEAPSGGREGVQLHDFLTYNPSAAQVRAEREKSRARVERFRNGGARGVTAPVGNGVTAPVGNGVSNASPTRPDPTPDPPLVPPPGGEFAEATSGTPPAEREQGRAEHPGPQAELFAEKPKAGRKRREQKPATAMPADWAPSEELFAFAAKRGMNRQQLEAELEQFRDRHAAKGALFVDWEAAARTWIRNVPKYGASRAVSPADDRPNPRLTNRTAPAPNKIAGASSA